jgi:hypothetical protein
MTDLDLKGKVSAIDVQKRQLTMKDELGVLHIYHWTAELDVVMRKWKVGYYLDIKYDADTYLIKSATYWQEGKDVFPKDTKSYQKPRNEKLIVIQSCAKLGADVFAITTTPDTMDFDTAMDLIIDRAIKDAEWIMKAGEQK